VLVDILGGLAEFALEVVGGLAGGAVDQRRVRRQQAKAAAAYDAALASRPDPPAPAAPAKPIRERVLPPAPFVIAASDATERELVMQLAAHPSDADTRMIYGDWLESRGDLAKASFVRGIDRYADVVAVVAHTDPAWRAIANCQPVVCSSWECPRRWQELVPVDGDPWLRRCPRPRCSRTTRYCIDLGDLRARRTAGEQVLLDLGTALPRGGI